MSSVSSGGGGGGGPGGGATATGEVSTSDRPIEGQQPRWPRDHMMNLKNPTRAQDILSIVDQDRTLMTPMCVGAAFNKLGKMAPNADFLSRRFQKISSHETFRELLRQARRYAEAGRLHATSAAVTLNGIAKLHQARRLDADDDAILAGALAALEKVVKREAHSMKPQEVAMTLWAFGKLAVLPEDDTWEAMNAAVARVAPNMVSQSVTSAMWAFATLGRMPEHDAWVALDAAAARVAPAMNAQELSMLLWTYGALEVSPSPETWHAMDVATIRVAPHMTPQGVSNTMWGYVKLEKRMDEEVWAALVAAAEREAPKMNPQEMSITLYTYAKLDKYPSPEAWIVYDRKAAMQARSMNVLDLTFLLWAYTKMLRIPSDKTWHAVDSALVRLSDTINPQGVTQALYSYAVLGRVPRRETLAALNDAFGRMEGRMELSSRDAACFVWGYAVLHTLWGVEYPPCHAAVWDSIRTSMDRRDFTDEALGMLFHTHLIRTCLPSPTSSSSSSSSTPTSGHLANVAYPDWLMEDGRNAWMRNVLRTSTSNSHLQLANIIGRLGFRHETERLTEDGYFSMDIYLQDYDVAIEFDGPLHYYSNYMDEHGPSYFYSNGASSRSGRTRLSSAPLIQRTKTELRNLLLAQRCAKVVTVPFTDFRREREAGPTRVNAYVKGLLKDALADLEGQKNEAEAAAATTTATTATTGFVGDECDAAADQRLVPAAPAPPPSAPEAVERDVEAEIERWKSALPKVALEKLSSKMSAAPTREAARWVALKSASADKTKVRAAARRALLDAFARLPPPPGDGPSVE